MVQVHRLEELKKEMEIANQEYKEALAQAGQLPAHDEDVLKADHV